VWARIHEEAAMAAPRGVRLITLGWQSWAIVAVVLTIGLLAGMLVLVW